MSLEKGIQYGKEHRKPYYRSGRYDLTCRPNGSCPYCKSNRYHKHKKKHVSQIQEIRDLE
jgi:hypothetical protein